MGLFDFFKDDAQAVDAIRSGKELRERQEELQKSKGGITEELMKQNPELFNQITSNFSTPVIGNKFTIGDMFTARSALQGNPFGMFGLGLIALDAFKETPEQKAVSGLYDLDDTGTVQSGIMAGYNPSSILGPVGLTKSMLARIDTINKNKVISDTLERRKKELEAKIAAEQKALQDFNRANRTGGYQEEAGYDKDFMEGSGESKDMGST